MVATMHTRQKTGAAGATETRKTRHGNDGAYNDLGMQENRYGVDTG